jgi:hypothetical protein
MDQPSSRGPDRILIIGRSPSVILDAAEILRTKGFQADATNQFDEVLTAYDTTEVDVVLFGGMVPADTKRHLRDEISKVNDHVTFVQGLAGIPGLIAAQIEGAVSPAGDGVTYDPTNRTLHLTLKEPTEVIINAFWGTSFTPPEPKSTSRQLLDSTLDAGEHAIPLPTELPTVASFASVSVGPSVHTFTIGPMPEAVTRLTPTANPTQPSPLPPVRAISTHTAN